MNLYSLRWGNKHMGVHYIISLHFCLFKTFHNKNQKEKLSDIKSFCLYNPFPQQ